jgi:hypothetical protein
MTSNRDKLSWFHPDSLIRQLVLGYCDGNQAEAARRFNVSRQQMQLWVSRGFLPASRVFDAQQIACGQITAEQFMTEFIRKTKKSDL